MNSVLLKDWVFSQSCDWNILLLTENFLVSFLWKKCMNNHIYSTLYKRLERKSDRRSKETEQRKNHKTHTQNNNRTCDLNLLH